mgnify:CR=1 FL=1
MNFFKISGVPNENVRELKMTKFNTMVTNALFNLRFEVLLLEKGNERGGKRTIATPMLLIL